VLTLDDEKYLYRVKFEKIDNMKFIGHLDLLKLFQRAVKRSGLPVAYSKGFNPHQIMSFALPLSVGIESIGEIVDIEFTKELDCTDAALKLNVTMPDGLKVLNVKRLLKGEKNAAASLTAAIYEVVFPKEISPEIIDEILNRNEIIVTKKSKKGEKTLDIRPMIYKIEALGSSAIQLTIATGSALNLKAEVAAELICERLDMPYVLGDVRIKRLELFGEKGSL